MDRVMTIEDLLFLCWVGINYLFFSLWLYFLLYISILFLFFSWFFLEYISKEGDIQYALAPANQRLSLRLESNDIFVF